MLYAASSRRSTIRLQRQASSKRSLVGGELGTSSSSAARPSSARPNTANSFQAGRRPTNPYKNSADTERIRHSAETFMLTDDDLQHFYNAFCYMAKDGKVPPTAPAPQKTARPRKKDKASVTTNPQPPWEEKDSSTTLPISGFFATFQISHASWRGGFLDGIFDLVGTRDLHAMTFGEFLDGMCTFGMMKLDDLVKFTFFVLDKEKEGLIPRFQLLRFIESLHGKKILVFEQAILPNTTAQSHLKDTKALRLPAAERQHACVDYSALKKLCTDYPTMLEPMLLFQSTLRRRVLGEKWWRRKENEIEKHFRTLDQTREKTRRWEEKRLMKQRKEKIRSEIGWVYYLRGRSRREAEKKHPRPIVSLEEETGEVRVEWTRTDGNDDNGSVPTG